MGQDKHKLELQLKEPINKTKEVQVIAQKKKQQVLKLILRVNMQKPNLKNEKENKHGMNSRDKWTRWNYQTKKKTLLSRKFSTKNQRTTDFKELRYQ